MNKRQIGGEQLTAMELRELVLGMRSAFIRCENPMQYARMKLGRDENLQVATLIAYDLQAGSYITQARAAPDKHDRWCTQIAGLLEPFVSVDSYDIGGRLREGDHPCRCA
jgi:hypothetical protein